MVDLKLKPPLSSNPSTWCIPDHELFPNTASALPVVHYQPFDMGETNDLDPEAIEQLVRRHSLRPQWRYTMYDFDHFHSTAHEVLIPFRGEATIVLGGHKEIVIRAGDVLVIPAGVAHRAMQTAGGFSMVGSYPIKGMNWDMCKGGEDGVEQRIKELGKGELSMDPVYGTDLDGPVVKAWELAL